MSFLKQVINAAVTEAVNQLGMLRIEQCCQQLGWDIDHRIGNDAICLNFPDPVLGNRLLLITMGGTGKIAMFSTACSASLTPHDLPPDLGYVLLLRNKELGYAHWQLNNNGGKAGFRLSATVLVAGLEPGIFKGICEEIVEEAQAVDSHIRARGLT